MLTSGAETTRVATYSAYDPAEVPSLVLALLHLFEGRDVEAASAEFARVCGFALDASLARKLADFDILVATAE